MRSTLYAGFFSLAVVSFVAGEHLRTAKPATMSAVSTNTCVARNEGYALLYKVVSDESGVSRIFYLKHADDSLGSVVNDIDKSCKDARIRLDDFAKADPTLAFDVHHLPAVELESRDLQSHDDTVALFSNSGPSFDRRLAFTQAEAMEYAKELCDALLKHETNPNRIAYLKVLSQQSGTYEDRLLNLLNVK